MVAKRPEEQYSRSRVQVEIGVDLGPKFISSVVRGDGGCGREEYDEEAGQAFHLLGLRERPSGDTAEGSAEEPSRKLKTAAYWPLGTLIMTVSSEPSVA